MTITRDPTFPAETAALFQAFNRCAEGHEPFVVMTAAVNLLVAAIYLIHADMGASKEDAEAYAKMVGDELPTHVTHQWDRKPQETDVAVPLSQ